MVSGQEGFCLTRRRRKEGREVGDSGCMMMMMMMMMPVMMIDSEPQRRRDSHRILVYRHGAAALQVLTSRVSALPGQTVSACYHDAGAGDDDDPAPANPRVATAPLLVVILPVQLWVTVPPALLVTAGILPFVHSSWQPPGY
eukprot:1825943-Rhodomonas_salina.2